MSYFRTVSRRKLTTIADDMHRAARNLSDYRVGVAIQTKQGRIYAANNERSDGQLLVAERCALRLKQRAQDVSDITQVVVVGRCAPKILANPFRWAGQLIAMHIAHDTEIHLVSTTQKITTRARTLEKLLLKPKRRICLRPICPLATRTKKAARHSIVFPQKTS